jgi:hypothetical protein
VLVRFTSDKRLAHGIKDGRCAVAALPMVDVARYAAAGGLLDLTEQVAARRKEFFPAYAAGGRVLTPDVVHGPGGHSILATASPGDES